MAAVVPISRPHTIAAEPRYKAVAIAVAASAVTALIRLTGLAPGADPVQDLRLPSRFTSTFLRQPTTTRVAAVTLEGSSGNTCVMALGKNAKLSVGFGDLSRDTIVSLAPVISTMLPVRPCRPSCLVVRASAPETSSSPAATRSRPAPS